MGSLPCFPSLSHTHTPLFFLLTQHGKDEILSCVNLQCSLVVIFPELDFRSGARVEELNKLIQEFTKHDQGEYDDQRALEIHTAKDFIFSMLGMVQKLDPQTASGQ